MSAGGHGLTVHVTSFLGVTSAATARFDVSKDADQRRPAVSIVKLAEAFRRARGAVKLSCAPPLSPPVLV